MLDILRLLLCYLASSLLMGGIGIFCSSYFKRTPIATISAYGILVVLTGGSWLVNQLAANHSLFGRADQAESTGGLLYLLLENPVTTFICTVLKLAAEDASASDITRWFGTRNTNFVISNWINCSILLQLMAGIIFIGVAVYVLGKRRHLG